MSNFHHHNQRGKTSVTIVAACEIWTKRRDQAGLNLRYGAMWLCKLTLAILFIATPVMASVSVSLPSSNSTVISPVQFSATSTTTTCARGVASMGVYIDNKLVYVEYGHKLSVKLPFKDGKYETVVEEWDRCGGATYTRRNIIVVSTPPTESAYHVDLSWDAPESSAVPVVGYNIYRSPSGSSAFQLINSTVDTETTYDDSTVQSGQSYDYAIESIDADGVESAPSSEVTVTIP